MAKSRKLVPGVALLVGGALVGCAPPDLGDGPTTQGDEQTTEARSALTTSLFDPYVAYPTGSWPTAVAIGDLDGDGRNDVALLTSYYFDAANDFMLNVFLQDAAGGLKPRVKYAVGARASSIDVGDVNGDGRADVVVGIADTAGTYQIGVFVQNAAGTLDPMVAYPTANSYQVKIGDFNGDGRMDVAGLNMGVRGDGLDVFLQTETGVLAAPVTYHVPHGGRDELDAGDVDGDGRSDLVVMSGQGAAPNVSVLLQTADGVFGPPASYSVGGGISTAGVALADTNGDGRTDIVVSYGGNRPNSFIARFLQNVGGGMDAAVSCASYDIPSAIVLADVDGDGRKDALVTHSGWNRLGVYRQFPSGDFVREELAAIPYASQYEVQGLAVGDISGDGRPDAVIADYNNGLVVLRHVKDDSLALIVTAPTGGPFYVGVPLSIRWSAGDSVPLAGFDVSVSFNSGASYTPIAGCTGLPATARDCVWTPAVPAGSAVRVRVTATDASSKTAFAETTINLLTPSITITAPGSNQFVGATSTISWFHNLPTTGTVRIELSRDGGASYTTLADGVPISTGTGTGGSFPWTVTGPATNTARVRVTANGGLPAIGISSPFSILTPTVTVTAPAAGATLYTTSLSVAWTTNVTVAANVRIELSRDGGSTFETVAAAAPNWGTFSGSVTGPGAVDARIRVTTNGAVVAAGVSPSFTLVQPSVAVAAPPAGGVVYAGAPQVIAWSTNLPATAAVLVELSRDGGSTYQTVAANVPNTGSLAWVPSGPDTGAARVRVTAGGSWGTTAATSGAFAIVTPSVEVAGPGPGSTYYAGTPLAITWTTNLPATSPVLVELSRDGGSTFETLAAAAPNTGTFDWTVTGPDSAVVVARVTLTDPIAMSGTSGAFGIVTPSLTVTGPSAGTLFYAGTPVTITWTHNLTTVDPVSIELSRDGGATFEVLDPAAANTGSFVWTASGPDTAQARVRVASSGAVSVSCVGPAFQILTPVVTVTSPAAGDNWAIGTARTISWSSDLLAGTTVAVALSRDGGAAWTTLASAAPATGSLAWTATGPATSAAIVRISANGNIPAVGTSGAFSIGNPAVAVTSPAAGASWTIGTAQTIAWTSNLLPTATVKIQLSRNGGSTYTTLTSSTPNTGSFAWTATGGATTTALVKVTANGFPASAVSGTFSIVAASVTVTAPNTAVTWTIGSVQAITWTHNVGAGAQFQIEVSRSGSWSVIAPAVPGSGATTGSYQWTVTGPKTSNAKVRVTWTGGTAKDASDVAFKIN
jgi:hypothetical protein